MPRHSPHPTSPTITTSGALTIGGVTVHIERTPSHPATVSIDTATTDQTDPVDLEIFFYDAKIFEPLWQGDEQIIPVGVTSDALTTNGITVRIAWDPVRGATVFIDTDPDTSDSEELDILLHGEMIFKGSRADPDLAMLPLVVTNGTAPTEKAAADEHGSRRTLRR
ncbi:hypothetical protein MXD63_26580 [Frankia sp. Cpl3]|nr:hypothetical protein [Frankia sp. Cpl3]